MTQSSPRTNVWADPDGYAAPPPPVRYRVRAEDGRIVERQTSVAFDATRSRYYHSLAPQDQPFADSLVAMIQRACAYFYAADDEYTPIDGIPESRITDREVVERIERLEKGENVREAERTGQKYYPLTDLPFDQQRALVEQIEALKQKWGFEILGEVRR